MPDRIIRDEILESERWLGLKDNADRLAFLALVLKADALGNFTASPQRLLRLWRDFGISSLPLVAKVLTELADADLVRLYAADGKPCLHIPRFRQRLRYGLDGKFPRPPEHVECKEIKLLLGKRRERAGIQSGDSQVHAAEVKEVKEVKEVPITYSSADSVTSQPPQSVKNARGDKSPSNNKTVPNWWTSEAGTNLQAQRLGLTARGGESWDSFRDRIRNALSIDSPRHA